MKNKFINYEEVYINFIFSFTWDITKIEFKELREKYFSDKNRWRPYHIHERPFQFNKGRFLDSYYHPNLISENTKVLQRNDYFKKMTICVPTILKDKIEIKDCNLIKTDMYRALRIFENGTGICTFCFHLKEGNSTFMNIHRIMRLSPNIANCKKITYTNSYLMNSDTNEFFTIFDFFSKSLEETMKWLNIKNNVKNGKNILLDPKLLSLNDFHFSNNYNWQSPYIFTVGIIDEKDYNEIFCSTKYSKKNQCIAKEIASIICKFTLENISIEKDYKYLGLEYIKKHLGYKEEMKRLSNLCLDERLFFNFSRRGAITITSNIHTIPSKFVIPSLLNLIELLRARWHLCNIVNIALDQAIYKISLPNKANPSTILDNIFEWRTLFALNLRDPVPSLFDGGSITEIAEIGEEKFWLNKLIQDTYRKFETLDKLIKDLYTRKRYEEFKKWMS